MVEYNGPSEVRGHLGHLKMLKQLGRTLQHYHLVHRREGGREGGGEGEDGKMIGWKTGAYGSLALFPGCSRGLGTRLMTLLHKHISQ